MEHEIEMLWNQGLDSMDIAEQLGLNVEQVDSVISTLDLIDDESNEAIGFRDRPLSVEEAEMLEDLAEAAKREEGY